METEAVNAAFPLDAAASGFSEIRGFRFIRSLGLFKIRTDRKVEMKLVVGMFTGGIKRTCDTSSNLLNKS